MTKLASSMSPKGYIASRARALRPQCVIGTPPASGGSHARARMAQICSGAKVGGTHLGARRIGQPFGNRLVHRGGPVPSPAPARCARVMVHPVCGQQDDLSAQGQP
jgi:hypothetical protein